MKTIDLREIVHVLKAAIILTSAHLNLSNPFVVSHVKSAKVFPERRLNWFGDPEKCSFPLNRVVPSVVEVTGTKIM